MSYQIPFKHLRVGQVANVVNLFLVLNFCPTICPTILPQLESDSKEQFKSKIAVSYCN